MMQESVTYRAMPHRRSAPKVGNIRLLSCASPLANRPSHPMVPVDGADEGTLAGHPFDPRYLN